MTDFAKQIGVSRLTISRVINGKESVTPELSVKLAEAFGQPTRGIWFKMQNAHDEWQAKHKGEVRA